MKHDNHPPDGYVLHKEWYLWTFSPHKYSYSNGNNSAIAGVIIFPFFIFMLPKVIMGTSNHTTNLVNELIIILPATIAGWLLCKVFSRILSGQWCRIHIGSIRIFPGWNGAVTKKVVNRNCVGAPILSLICLLIAYYLLPALFTGALMVTMFFLMFMLATGVNLAFKLIDEPEHVLIALERKKMRLYIPKKRD